ncbi:MAG: T9SS type A sorting domain-containing protein [Candidatus Marinimicrobia bacterium]|nr:T9SS type A sorting domain-containing protein [Candidatus Neomarinimicrobiota bacterium]MCF7829331.1 T9SS type A sorting domain-containing protein [Candidatus Neomarinimicrobiota bacterium]MCF7880007.1 T9SS type A sorting domain-containing protein [Candidatus Neomarinimicrobiota bacterium]
MLKTTTGGKIPVGIEGENPDDLLVSEFTLHPCYPNPFNPVTSVRYDVPEATEMRVSVYNILGHEVDVLFDGYAEPGRYTIRWDAASQLPSGIYFVRMMTREYSRVQKVTLMK